jgi:hypothetical protein
LLLIFGSVFVSLFGGLHISRKGNFTEPPVSKFLLSLESMHFSQEIGMRFFYVPSVDVFVSSFACLCCGNISVWNCFFACDDSWKKFFVKAVHSDGKYLEL